MIAVHSQRATCMDCGHEWKEVGFGIYKCHKCYWIDDKGNKTVIGLQRTLGMYVDLFAFGSPLVIRRDNDAFRQIAGDWVYPKIKESGKKQPFVLQSQYNCKKRVNYLSIYRIYYLTFTPNTLANKKN